MTRLSLAALTALWAAQLRETKMEERKKPRREDLMTECSCGAMSYIGGWCFGCRRYRPSKPARFVEERDSVEHGETVFGRWLGE